MLFNNLGNIHIQTVVNVQGKNKNVYFIKNIKTNMNRNMLFVKIII